MSFIELISFSSFLGGINYWIGSRFDLYYFVDYEEKDEKYNLWVVLGLGNYFLHNEIIFPLLKELNHTFVWFVSLIVMITLQFMTINTIKSIESSIKGKNSHILFNKNAFTEMMISNEGYTYCQIFDFDNKFIEEGYIEHYNSKNNEGLAFSLVPIAKEDYRDTKYNDFRVDFGEKDEFIYIDFQTKVKVYIKFYKVKKGID
ncbi:hypothetical protein [Globicatella sanguinis]|uniref:hypothetical protein n=1 Tax=Globicatella sanguinis TaxID=13076 RepID=UPI000825B33E|nr:hypothetical protein [Globicatella sanguinis]